jgi:hypothetical protein
VFYVYCNWPKTKIESFTKDDVLQAIEEKRFESRSFQDPLAETELKKFFERLRSNDTRYCN